MRKIDATRQWISRISFNCVTALPRHYGNSRSLAPDKDFMSEQQWSLKALTGERERGGRAACCRIRMRVTLMSLLGPFNNHWSWWSVKRYRFGERINNERRESAEGTVNELREEKESKTLDASLVTRLDNATTQMKEIHRRNELKKSINFLISVDCTEIDRKGRWDEDRDWTRCSLHPESKIAVVRCDKWGARKGESRH